MHMQRACFTARATTCNGRLRNALQQTSQSPAGPQGRLAHHARCLLHVCGAGAPAAAASMGGGAGMTHDQLLAEFAKLIPILDGEAGAILNWVLTRATGMGDHVHRSVLSWSRRLWAGL